MNSYWHIDKKKKKFYWQLQVSFVCTNATFVINKILILKPTTISTMTINIVYLSITFPEPIPASSSFFPCRTFKNTSGATSCRELLTDKIIENIFYIKIEAVCGIVV